MKRTNIFFSERQLERLGLLAEKEGLSVGELVRRAVDAWLDEKEKDMSAKFTKDVSAVIEAAMEGKGKDAVLDMTSNPETMKKLFSSLADAIEAKQK